MRLSSDRLSFSSGDNNNNYRAGASANGTWLCLTDYRLRYLKQSSEEVPLRKGQAIKISDTIICVDWGVQHHGNTPLQSE